MLYMPKLRLQQATLDAGCRRVLAPATDILAHKDCYIIRCIMPGLEADDIAIGLKNGELTLRAAAKLDMPPGMRICAMEFSSANYHLRLTLPDDCQSENINAAYENGMLQITLPRKTQTLIKRVKVRQED